MFKLGTEPEKNVSSHLHTLVRPMLLQYGARLFSTLSSKFEQLGRFFWANGLPPPPPGEKFPYAYDRDFSKDFTIPLTILFVSREDKGDREGIPHIHPIPWVIRLELFLESG